MENAVQQEEDIFEAARQIFDKAQRQAFLEFACRENPEMRDRLLSMTDSSAVADQFFLEGGRALEEHRRICESPREKPGDSIGRYKILEKIGEGGCGIVYMAEQLEPVRRRVALKVVKLGMDTRSVVARFEVERQALAMMDHPNIARVLDAGATETGRPFFVMELVRGVRITDFCEQNQVPTRERLELFIQVCGAVQHAHQKGIIHRDLKPSNVLVTINDGVAVPKVIDFGIAKATEQRLTDKTLFTAFAQFLGTPAYMSPEQAGMTSVDVDTRADIYSLGVLLYELLTGQPPFDTQQLIRQGWDVVLQTIREKEPLRPSTRLGALPGETLTGLASRQKTDPPNLVHFIRGDIDWIAMKCLEKDRARRYETANGLAQDIKRFLNNEPVIARPPSKLYQMGKFARRNRSAIGATALVLITLVIGAVVSTVEAIQARRAVQRQAQLERVAEHEAANARLAEAQAKEELWHSYLAQAQAGRWSQRAGRRFEGLELLSKAARLRPSLELRNEAIACMALTDLRVTKDWQAIPDNQPIGFDGRYEQYVFGDPQGTVHLRRVSDSHELARFTGFGTPFRDIDLSPDARFLFVGGGPGNDQVQVLDTVLQSRVLSLMAPGYPTFCFSANSQLLALAYAAGGTKWSIHVFDLLTKRELGAIDHETMPTWLHFHPRRPNLLLSCDSSPVVRMWDWSTGRLIQTLTHPNWVQCLDVHPTEEIVAAPCADNLVYLWNLTTGKQIAAMPGHEWAPVRTSFSRDGSLLASRAWDGTLRIWDVHSKKQLVNKPIFGGAYPFGTVADQLAIVSGKGRVQLLEVSRGLGFRTLQADPESPPRSKACDFSADGQMLVSTDDFSLRLWDLPSGKETTHLSKSRGEYFPIFGSRGTNLFLASSSDIEDWALERGGTNLGPSLVLRHKINLPSRFGPLRLTQDGRTLLAQAASSLHFFDTADGRETKRLRLPYGDAVTAFSADGTMVATWNRFSTNVQVWNVATSALVKELPANPSIYAAFRPDGRALVIGDELEFSAWDVLTWKRLFSVPRVAASFYAFMSFSSDNRLLAVAISRSTVRLLSAVNGQELATLEAPDKLDLHWITFSPDATQLAAVCGSGPIQLWDLRAICQQLASMNLDWEQPPNPMREARHNQTSGSASGQPAGPAR